MPSISILRSEWEVKTHGSKPRIIPHKGRENRSDGSPPEAGNPVALDAAAEDGCAPGALRLEGCFERVDWSEAYSEAGGAEGDVNIGLFDKYLLWGRFSPKRNKNGLEPLWRILQVGVLREEGEDARVSCCVAEAC